MAETTQGIIHDLWPDAQMVAAIRRAYAPELDEHDFVLFASVCRDRRLDPRRGQICAYYRSERRGEQSQKRLCIVTRIDGYRAIAERAGKRYDEASESWVGEGLYMGPASLEWCGPDGAWRDAWLEKEPPVAARATVYRRGAQEPVRAIARYDAYVETIPVYENQKVVGRRPVAWWAKGPDHMTGKCAEALALRKAFPEDLGGLYIPEELPRDVEGPAELGPKAAPATLAERLAAKAAAVGTPPATPAPLAKPDAPPPTDDFAAQFESFMARAG